MTNARILQLTNNTIGAVATNTNLPLGTTTVIYPFDVNNCYPTYTVQSSNSDTLVVNKSGVYNFVYNASIESVAAGNVIVELIVNGTTKYTVTETVAAANSFVNLTIPFEIYIPNNCASVPNNIPSYIQVKNTGVALVSGTSNLIISKE